MPAARLPKGFIRNRTALWAAQRAHRAYFDRFYAGGLCTSDHLGTARDLNNRIAMPRQFFTALGIWGRCGERFDRAIGDAMKAARKPRTGRN